MEEKTEYYTTTTTTTQGPVVTSTTAYVTESRDSYDEKEVVLEDQNLDHVSDVNRQVIADEYDENGNLVDFVMCPVEKKLVFKLDFIYVMPYVCILNFLQFFDKSALNYAAVLGIKETANLTDEDFSWLGSIFYLGYLLFQGPSMVLIQKLPLSKYIGSVIVIWGLVLLLTFLGHNFSQLAALRFLLGFFEAGIYPCCIMLISSLYRRSEQADRIGLVYICNGVAMAVGGLIGYGIGHMHGVAGLESWQWIMIILGAITVVFGIFSFFFMVDNPKAKVLRLTPEEENIVDRRMRDNAVVKNKNINTAHIYESLKEPRFYAFCVCAALINFQNGALGIFSAMITQGFGFSNLNSILLTIPSGVTDCIYIAVAVWYNRHYGNTLYTGVVLLLIAILGLLLLVVIPIPKAKLLGLYLTWAFAASFVMLLVALANNVAGYTKKVFYSSSLMVFYTIGNFAGPFIMSASAPPLHVGSMIGYMVANAVTIVLFLYIRWSMVKENRKRMANPSTQEVLPDMTDVENKSFIYRV
ncbi:hypothetical protein HPULCUR_006705 [Helicostylum pulchrum]|uniref:Major facilitator superfamily (MFS) profile domain-containing protein n=1 Tax=Helicostylum pulchrum TaxID=562976 RepID=A0ABP9Y3Y5_9FUNG